MSETDMQATQAIEALMPKIQNYARLIVRTGAAITPGQELVVQGPVERADFIRMVVEEAYAAGAGHVTVIWADDATTRLEYQNVPTSYFEKTPEWKVTQLNSLAEKGAAFLFLDGSDPEALLGIDPAKPAAARLARNRDCKVFRTGLDFGRNAWCIAGVPVAAWARKVFPQAGEQEAILRLWEAILYTARADGEDPHAAWQEHNEAFTRNLARLNNSHFDALRYSSSNGTNLVVGMTAGHIWSGGSMTTVDGVTFFPNMPTEEVFTSPDRMRAEGMVFSAMPLVHAGQIVRNFWLRFEAGRVVEFGAEEGEEVLRHIVEADENSCHLGEVALISKNTPIRQTGLLFFDTLYDENASCHLALGTGFPECVEGGLNMSREELMEAGVNHSHTHVDFMIGSDDLNIWGIAADGSETPVFTDGQWAWE